MRGNGSIVQFPGGLVPFQGNLKLSFCFIDSNKDTQFVVLEAFPHDVFHKFGIFLIDPPSLEDEFPANLIDKLY